VTFKGTNGMGAIFLGINRNEDIQNVNWGTINSDEEMLHALNNNGITTHTFTRWFTNFPQN
jgi:hypothetical protein